MSTFLRRATAACSLIALAVLCACHEQLTLPPAPDNGAGDFVVIAETAEGLESLFGYAEGPLRFEPPDDAQYVLASLPLSLAALGLFEGRLATGSRRIDAQSSWQLENDQWVESGVRELELEAWAYNKCLDAGLCLGFAEAEPDGLDTCIPCAANLITAPEAPRGECPDGWVAEQIRSLTMCSPPDPAYGFEQCPVGERLNQERTACIDVSPCPAGRFPEPTPGMNAIYVDSARAVPGQGTLADPYSRLTSVRSPPSPDTEVLLSKGQHSAPVNLTGFNLKGAGRCSELNLQLRAAARWDNISLSDLTFTVSQGELQLAGTSTVQNAVLQGDGSLSLQGKTFIQGSRIALGASPAITLLMQADLHLLAVDASTQQLVVGAGQNRLEVRETNVYSDPRMDPMVYTFTLEASTLTVADSLFIGNDPPVGKGTFHLTDSSAVVRDVHITGQSDGMRGIASSVTMERTAISEGDTAFEGRFSEFTGTEITWRSLGQPVGDPRDSNYTVTRSWLIDAGPLDLPSPGQIQFTDSWITRSEDVSRFLFSSEGPADLIVNRMAVDAVGAQVLFGGFTSALDVDVNDLSVQNDGSTITISVEAFDANRVELLGIRQLRMEEALLARQEPGSTWSNFRIEQVSNAAQTNSLICLAKDHALRLNNFDVRSTGGAIIGLDANEGEGLGSSRLSQGTLRLPTGQLPYDVSGTCTGAPLSPDDKLPQHRQVELAFE